MTRDHDANEFMDFISGFLAEHPEVVEDRQRGWEIHWLPRHQAPVPLAPARIGRPPPPLNPSGRP